MRQLGLLVLAIVLGVAAWWWFSHEMPRRERERAVAAEAAARRSEQVSSLYRWRDANGVLQVTEQPPKGHRYERISRTPEDGIEVRGDRD
jgi:hypothetical protein